MIVHSWLVGQLEAHVSYGPLQEIRHKLHSPESRFQDPNYSAKRRKADLAAAEAHVSRSLGVRLSDLTSGAVALTSLKPAGPLPAAVMSGGAKEPALLLYRRWSVQHLDEHAADQDSCTPIH